MEKITYRKTLDVHKNGVQFMLQGFETADKMSRVVEISLMASGDAIDFPNERLVALMYVTSPGATEPSIYDCRLVDNKIIYEVLPIVVEGITEMQIKIIENDTNGPKSVFASPKFAVEVGKSNAEDEEAEKKPVFTALEEATARAKLAYDERFIRMEIAEDGTFKAYYADGTTYETDIIARMLVAASTELDLNALVKNGLTSFTADEVAREIKPELDAEYEDFFAKAIYSEDLMGNYPEARFVHWDENTIATPLKALLTDKTKGFALVMGDGTSNHTVLAWCVGEKTRTFYSRFIIDGNDTEWRDGLVDLSAEVKGVLPIEKGGMGAKTVKEAKENLEISKVSTPASYIAFVGHVNEDMLDAAFGKNNEDNIEGVGQALAMYGWYNGLSKKDYPFTCLCKMQTLNDMNINVFRELVRDKTLFFYILDSEYATNKCYDTIRIHGEVYNDEETKKTITVNFDVTEEDLTVPFGFVFSAKGTGAATNAAYVSINGVSAQRYYDPDDGKTKSTNGFDEWSKYNITSAGTYSLEMSMNVSSFNYHEVVSTMCIYKPKKY